MPRKNGVVDEKWASSSYIEWATFGKVGDSDTGEAYHKIMDVPTTLKLDDQGQYIYIGHAVPGSSPSLPLWRISRLDTTVIEKLWADGNTLFDNIWASRASLPYS